MAADLMVFQGDKIGGCLSRQFTKEIKANARPGRGGLGRTVWEVAGAGQSPGLVAPPRSSS